MNAELVGKVKKINYHASLIKSLFTVQYEVLFDKQTAVGVPLIKGNVKSTRSIEAMRRQNVFNIFLSLMQYMNQTVGQAIDIWNELAQIKLIISEISIAKQ